MGQPYLDWISKCRVKGGFVNSWYAVLLEYNLEEKEKNYNITYHGLEKELESEERGNGTSSVLRRFVIHCLDRGGYKVSTDNYEDTLRKVLKQDGVLPRGVSNPLSEEMRSFHDLPSQCKLYILLQLRQICGHFLPKPAATGKDTLSNTFYVLPSGRIFVRFDGSPEQLNHNHTTLLEYAESFVTSMIVRTMDDWRVIKSSLLKFKQNLLVEHLEEALGKCTPLPIEKSIRSSESEERVSKRDRKKRSEEKILLISERSSASSLLSTKTKKATEKTENPKCAVNTNNFKTSVTTQPTSKTRSKSKKGFPKRETLAETRCQLFPACKLNNCTFIHPVKMCLDHREGRECPGRFCTFLHGPCPHDGDCEDYECPFEHYESLPIGLRPVEEKLEQEQFNVRCPEFPLCTKNDGCQFVHPTVICWNFMENRCSAGRYCIRLHGPCPDDETCEDEECPHEHYDSLPYGRRPDFLRNKNRNTRFWISKSRLNGMSRSRSMAPSRAQSRARSVTSPRTPIRAVPRSRSIALSRAPSRTNLSRSRSQSKRSLYAEVEHDEDRWRSRSMSLYKSTSRVAFDRSTTDLRREHRMNVSRSRCNSVADEEGMRERIYDERENHKHVVSSFCSGEYERMSRYAASASDRLSTRSGRSFRNSCTDYSDEEANYRSTRRFDSIRCKFFPRCDNDCCEYRHPQKKCTVFPQCPYGGACLFEHERCPNDGVCIREACDYEHTLRRSISVSWCKYGSSCRNATCHFQHPKECGGTCPAPGNCWKLHRS